MYSLLRVSLYVRHNISASVIRYTQHLALFIHHEGETIGVRYFSKGISPRATSQGINYPSGNFPQALGGAAGCNGDGPGATARTGQGAKRRGQNMRAGWGERCGKDKLGKLPLGKNPLGKYVTSNYRMKLQDKNKNDPVHLKPFKKMFL